jgi:hypothetical protein
MFLGYHDAATEEERCLTHWRDIDDNNRGPGFAKEKYLCAALRGKEHSFVCPLFKPMKR